MFDYKSKPQSTFHRLNTVSCYFIREKNIREEERSSDVLASFHLMASNHNIPRTFLSFLSLHLPLIILSPCFFLFFFLSLPTRDVTIPRFLDVSSSICPFVSFERGIRSSTFPYSKAFQLVENEGNICRNNATSSRPSGPKQRLL